MYPYFLLLLAILFTSTINASYRKYFIFLILFIFSAIRFDVGFDFQTYYEVISDLNHSEYYRFGVADRALIDISRFFAFEQIYFIATSLFINYLVVKTFSKYSSNIFISTLVYLAIPIFYLYSFSIIRQFVAISIVIYSVKYIIRRNAANFSISILIATLFHASALVALPLYFITAKRFSNITLLALSLLATLSPVTVKPLIETYLPYYSHYLSSNGSHGWTMMYLLSIFFAFAVSHGRGINTKKGILFYNAYAIGFFLYAFFIQFGEVAPRVSFYYLIFLTLLLPELLANYKNKQALAISSGLFIALFFVNFYFFDKIEVKNPYLPYQSFLSVEAHNYTWK